MYKPKGIKNEHMLNMRRTYGASMSQHHFAYLIKNPILPPSVREALTKEAGCKSGESGKAYSRNTLKTQTWTSEEVTWRGFPSLGRVEPHWGATGVAKGD